MVKGRTGPGAAAWQGRVAGLACALVLLAGCLPGGPRPPVPGGAPTTTSVEVGDRSALLYVPAGRSTGVPSALVVVLHGYTGDASGALAFFGLRALADQRGFLVAAPQGTADRQGRAFWNASRACCNFEESDVDDSGYLSRLITAIVAGHAVDPARVYVVGHSNGGFMAHRFACEHADQVQAIASLAGALDADTACTPAEPVSVVQVHGRADDTIHYRGGRINGRPYTSAAETVAWWRRADGCRGGARSGERLDADSSVPGQDLTPTAWGGCREGTQVALWTIARGSHVPALTPGFMATLYDWFEANRRRP